MTSAAPARRPDLSIIGALKCGTTSLYEYLEGHPQIYMREPLAPALRQALEEEFAADVTTFLVSSAATLGRYGSASLRGTESTSASLPQPAP